MKAFLSWSGNISKLVAVALRDWLPMTLQEVEPWLSSDDVPIGENWSQVISKILRQVDLGIICLTKVNIDSSWLNFEAGAISKNENARVCALCIDFDIKELKGPLSQFQSFNLTTASLHQLIRDINQLLTRPVNDSVLDEVFKLTYPLLAERIKEILLDQTNNRSLADVDKSAPEGIVISKLDEILSILRPASENSSKVHHPALVKPIKTGKQKIFVGSSTEGLDVAHAIQENLQQDADVTLWSQESFSLTTTAIESIVDLTYRYDFAILVFTGDDVLTKRGKQHTVARDNILFELGLFTGALGRARTFLVYDHDANIHLPSDLSGVTAATYFSRSDGNLLAALGPVCQRIKRAMGTADANG